MNTPDHQLEIQEIIAKLPPSQLAHVVEFLREMYRMAQSPEGKIDFNWARVGQVMRENDEVLRRPAQ